MWSEDTHRNFKIKVYVYQMLIAWRLAFITHQMHKR